MKKHKNLLLIIIAIVFLFTFVLESTAEVNADSHEDYAFGLLPGEFVFKKNAPWWKKLLERLTDTTIIIPWVESSKEVTLIIEDNLTSEEASLRLIMGIIALFSWVVGFIRARSLKKTPVIWLSVFLSVLAASAVENTDVITQTKGLWMLMAGVAAGVVANLIFVRRVPKRYIPKEKPTE